MIIVVQKNINLQNIPNDTSKALHLYLVSFNNALHVSEFGVNHKR